MSTPSVCSLWFLFLYHNTIESTLQSRILSLYSLLPFLITFILFFTCLWLLTYTFLCLLFLSQVKDQPFYYGSNYLYSFRSLSLWKHPLHLNFRLLQYFHFCSPFEKLYAVNVNPVNPLRHITLSGNYLSLCLTDSGLQTSNHWRIKVPVLRKHLHLSPNRIYIIRKSFPTYHRWTLFCPLKIFIKVYTIFFFDI